jgi:hypothetical protein
MRLRKPRRLRKTELLTTVIVHVLSICQQFVWEVTVEDHSAIEEQPKKWDTSRELVNNVDVTTLGYEE